MTTYADELRFHYEGVWGQANERIRLSEGPLWELPAEYSVLMFSPITKADGGRAWRYATCGMSQPNDDLRLELFIEAPQRTQRVVDILNMTAHYHRTGARLGHGHSVNFGSPWLPGSQCEFGLVSLPYLDGPRLEKASVVGKEVRVLWLIPVTKPEIEYKKQRGLEALEEAFERSNFNYLDPRRRSVV